MVMLEASMNELQHSRSVLLRAIKDLSSKQLDLLLFPDSKSIGEILLHMAGFEFMIISAGSLLANEKPDLGIWQKLKPGFSREGGFQAPKGYALDHYLDALAEIRDRCISYFAEQVECRFVAKTNFPIVPLAKLLRDNDPGADAQQYEKLATAVCTSFEDDGAVSQRGETDLVRLLQLHETYHRGQITFQKYIYARLKGSGELLSQ
jgi:uncharacterized damage-inducible protein DinB